MSSVKCPKCSLVNFAGEEKCKRCGADLSESQRIAEEDAALRAEYEKKKPTPHPNLSPCPDCARMISRQAESCPQCGRFIQRFKITVDRTGWAGTIGWGVVLSSFMFFLLGVLFWVVIVALFAGGSAVSR